MSDWGSEQAGEETDTVGHNRRTPTGRLVNVQVLSDILWIVGVRRTAVVKLAVSDEQRDALHRTAEYFGFSR